MSKYPKKNHAFDAGPVPRSKSTSNPEKSHGSKVKPKPANNVKTDTVGHHRLARPTGGVKEWK